jgi:agmatinase
MPRYGPQFGPDFTFLGVAECDLDDEASYADADVVILGAPFDGGTSYRAGARFGPQAIRMTDYLPHDGARPSLALRTDGLQDLKVYDAGDVEMYSGDIEVALPALQRAVERVAAAGAMPVILGGDHSIAYPDAKGCANVIGAGRVSMLHFDAHADTGDIEFGSLWGHGQPMRRLIESGAVRGDRFLQIGLRGYWPPPETLDWMASQQMRSFEMTEIVQRGLRDCLTERSPSPPTNVTGCSSQSTSMCVIQDMHPAPAPRSRVVCPRANCWMRCGGFASSCPSSGWMWLRSARRTTTRTSLQHWPIEWS